jgi:hypothetical protein
MYSRWAMQEDTMVSLTLDFSRPLEDWTIYGSAADCVATLLETQSSIGLDGVGFTIYSLPEGSAARIEYMQMIAEDIVAPVVRATTPSAGGRGRG